MISICMITYNHENFLRSSIDGVLLQKTKFPFEIIIGDDCSTDGTRLIIDEYVKEYPDIIKKVYQDKNVGANKNFISIWHLCRQKYIALCEGDDYWTDPYKLQKQVDFLEQNPDYVICFTDVMFSDERSNVEKVNKRSDREDFDIYDLIEKNYVSTLTTVYRNVGVKLKEDFCKLKVGDWPMHILHAQSGKVKRLPIVTGVYRIHHNNSWEGQDKVKRDEAIIELFEYLKRNLISPYRKQILKKLNGLYYSQAINYYDQSIFKRSGEFLSKISVWNETHYLIRVLLLKFKIIVRHGF